MTPEPVPASSIFMPCPHGYYPITCPVCSPRCLWCEKPITGERARVDRWNLHPSCAVNLKTAVLDVTWEPSPEAVQP